MTTETENIKTRAQNAVVGAVVADAAALGFHWLYDQQRISDLAGAEPEFRSPNPDDYKDVRGYFAHPGKSSGEVSQYGEQLMVMLHSMSNNNGRYDKVHYENAFDSCFGYGGTYVGYIDRPTRDTLNNIALAKSKSETGELDASFRGADDTQLPAISKLPPLVAKHHNQTDLQQLAESAVRVTNNNDFAVGIARCASAMLKVAIETGDITRTLQTAASVATEQTGSEKLDSIKTLVSAAASEQDKTVVEATAHWGMPCQLDVAFPSVLHNLEKSNSYTEAIRQNILAGGDSCGRAILLGAILGACNGNDENKGIPSNWLARIKRKDELLEALHVLLV